MRRHRRKVREQGTRRKPPWFWLLGPHDSELRLRKKKRRRWSEGGGWWIAAKEALRVTIVGKEGDLSGRDKRARQPWLAIWMVQIPRSLFRFESTSCECHTAPSLVRWMLCLFIFDFSIFFFLFVYFFY